MDASLIVTIFGLVLLIVSLKFLKDPSEIKHLAKDVTSNHGVMFIAGIIPLILGTIILFLLGPVYSTGHVELLATLLGGILFLIGVFRLWCREKWCEMVKARAKGDGSRGMVLVMFIISILLLLIGGGHLSI
ncbi:MAG: hypothetical protein VX737_06985 [Pseudomonadota bacterium]|nr:hypothetical protein [Pseudomonadota bacterium]